MTYDNADSLLCFGRKLKPEKAFDNILDIIEERVIADLGVVVEMRLPFNSDYIEKATERLSCYRIIATESGRGNDLRPGVLVYYNSRTVKVTDIEVNIELQQIHCIVQSLEHPSLVFQLCAFYIHPSEVGTQSIENSAKIWKGLINKNLPFVAVGDLNLYVFMDENNFVKDIQKTSHVRRIKTFKQFIMGKNFKQLNPFPNDFGNTIDVILVKDANNELEIETRKEKESALLKHRPKEKAHNPLLFFINLRKNE